MFATHSKLPLSFWNKIEHKYVISLALNGKRAKYQKQSKDDCTDDVKRVTQRCCTTQLVMPL